MMTGPDRSSRADPLALADRVKATGRALGFDVVAIGQAGPVDHGEAFERWLAAGYQGTMAYLERGRAKRLDPGLVLEGARSLIACALNYHQGPGPPGGESQVARYAWGSDYHVVMEPRLKALGADLEAAAPGVATRAYVDTGPLLERELAARAGLGWIGKNTMLLHPALGSFFFIGIVLTTAELSPDPILPDRCGSCTRCLEACPTDAFPAPRVLDARRCLAYLTIEHRGPIPEGFRGEVGRWVFGCDECQDVCPWNRRAPVTAEPAFRARPLPGPAELAVLDGRSYRERLAGSPLRRAGRAGLARNACAVLGRSRAPGADQALRQALADPDPVVREQAAWSLRHRPADRAG